MTVTIHLAPGATKTVLRRLITLAGGDRTAIRSGHTGLVVSDELALAYLSDGQSSANDGQVSHPAPPNLARLVRGAEDRAGITTSPDGSDPKKDPAPTTSRTPAARRPRRTSQQGVPTT